MGAHSAVTHGAAACGVVGHWPSFDLALGCEGHYHASTRPAAGARTAQPSRGQKYGTRRCSCSLHKKVRRDGRHTGSTLGDGEHKDMGLSRSYESSRRLHARLSRPAAWPRARVAVRGHSRACARTALPCLLSAAAWYPEARHGAAWRGTKLPLQTDLGSTAGSFT
jgi:hypothetical protein